MPMPSYRFGETYDPENQSSFFTLGNKKVVVMQNENDLHIYSDNRPCRQPGLSLQRISEAVSAK